jgi:type I site-specific restriction endonuclease
VRIEPGDIRKKGKVPKNGSLFFTIFQTFMSGPPKDGKPSPYFGEYPPDFFDFIVIDECHRGGANDESNWRGILDYFAPAVQLGLNRHAQAQGQRGHLRLFRRAGVHLLAQGRHQRRLPDALQGEADSDDAG